MPDKASPPPTLIQRAKWNWVYTIRHVLIQEYGMHKCLQILTVFDPRELRKKLYDKYKPREVYETSSILQKTVMYKRYKPRRHYPITQTTFVKNLSRETPKLMFYRKRPSRLYRLKRKIYLKTHPKQARLEAIGNQMYHFMIATGFLFILLLVLRLIYLRTKKNASQVQMRWHDTVRRMKTDVRRAMTSRNVEDVDNDEYDDW